MANKRKHRRGGKQRLNDLEFALQLNGTATLEGPKRKTWSIHDLKTIKPLTDAQSAMFQSFYNGYNVCAHGSAGTGKTFLALYLALNEMLATQNQSHIKIVRSAVPTRDVGHLPGTYEEKIAQYEVPYRELVHELLGRYSSYDDMKSAGKIEFLSTSYLRGLTWDNAIIIVDEGQNMTFHEIDSIMSRVGENARVIFTGDLVQTDLDRKQHDKCGMGQFMKVIGKMDGFADIRFTQHDIVRSAFCKSWIMATEEVNAA